MQTENKEQAVENLIDNAVALGRDFESIIRHGDQDGTWLKWYKARLHDMKMDAKALLCD